MDEPIKLEYPTGGEVCFSGLENLALSRTPWWARLPIMGGILTRRNEKRRQAWVRSLRSTSVAVHYAATKEDIESAFLEKGIAVTIEPVK